MGRHRNTPHAGSSSHLAAVPLPADLPVAAQHGQRCPLRACLHACTLPRRPLLATAASQCSVRVLQGGGGEAWQEGQRAPSQRCVRRRRQQGSAHSPCCSRPAAALALASPLHILSCVKGGGCSSGGGGRAGSLSSHGEGGGVPSRVRGRRLRVCVVQQQACGWRGSEAWRMSGAAERAMPMHGTAVKLAKSSAAAPLRRAAALSARLLQLVGNRRMAADLARAAAPIAVRNACCKHVCVYTSLTQGGQWHGSSDEVVGEEAQRHVREVGPQGVAAASAATAVAGTRAHGRIHSGQGRR
jgi:hypothetical protein